MNKSTRITIAVLTSLFLIAQIILGLAFLNLIIAAFVVFFSGLPKSIPNGAVLLGIKTSNYNLPLLSERQIVLLIFLFALAVLAVTFFLFQYLRTILQNLNEGEVFGEYNLKYIRRIMLLYLTLGIGNFLFEFLHVATHSTYNILGTEDLIIGLLQVFMMTAGIYTLYFVFKHGTRLQKDNEEIV